MYGTIARVKIDPAKLEDLKALGRRAVLVVGSGQSGCQIAEELHKSGRRVFLSVGSAGRAPRRYRGKDTYQWLALAGFFDRTPDMLPSPKARFAANPHLSGAGGGHDLNLHQFARDGMTLLGHLRDAGEGKLGVAPDLHESLAKSDQFEARVLGLIDGYLARNGLDAPEERLPVLRDGYDQPQVTALDVPAAGITTVIWAAGYSFDFSLVKLPVTDGDGFPVQQRGVTAYPGLYFVGLPWLHTQKSGLLLGVGEDAAFIAGHIAQSNCTQMKAPPAISCSKEGQLMWRHSGGVSLQGFLTRNGLSNLRVSLPRSSRCTMHARMQPRPPHMALL